MMNIPPKSIKKQIALNGGIPASQTGPTQNRPQTSFPGPTPDTPAPAVYTAADLANMDAVTAESLPVLQAFQDFLASERKHARRQVVALSIFFLMLFVILTGAGSFFGYVYFEKMNGEIAFLHNELTRTKSSLTQEAADVLAGLKERTDALSSRIVDGDDLIQKATAEISTTVSKSLTQNVTEIEAIKAALAALKDENLALRKDLVRMRTVQPVMVASTEPPPDTGVTDRTPVSEHPPIAPEDDQPIVRREPKPLKGNKLMPLEIAILAPGTTSTMKWRIPISE